MNFEDFDAVLDFAIEREIESAKFYTELSEMVERPEMKSVFKGFAAEEKGHQLKLEKMKKLAHEGVAVKPAVQKVQGLKIADYLVDVEPMPNMEYQDALIVAMKKEKAAFRLYLDLAGKFTDPDLKDVFLALSQEEAKHKVRFEIEYDDFVFSQD
jgi:rubrerythrin